MRENHTKWLKRLRHQRAIQLVKLKQAKIANKQRADAISVRFFAIKKGELNGKLSSLEGKRQLIATLIISYIHVPEPEPTPEPESESE